MIFSSYFDKAISSNNAHYNDFSKYYLLKKIGNVRKDLKYSQL